MNGFPYFSNKTTSRPNPHGLLMMGTLGTWLILVGAGMAYLGSYSGSAGAQSTPPAMWPDACAIRHDADRATLVMFAHPQCPCTRATLTELARLMRYAHPKLSAHVFFTAPSVFPDGWEQTDLWSRAASIPGVAVHRDPDGAEARRFGAQTSGAVAVYGARGELRFNGGITHSRGHEGDNTGSKAILAILGDANRRVYSTPVFGCALANPPPAPPCCTHAAKSEGSTVR